MISSLQNLWQRDQRRGDNLIQPLRILIAENNKTINEIKHHPNRSIFTQALRICKIALCSIAILAMSLLAVCGMILKSLDPLNIADLTRLHPKTSLHPKLNFWHLLNIQPLPQERAAPPSDQAPLTENNLIIKKLPEAIFVFTASFLHPQELVEAMRVSRFFCQQMRSPLLWSSYLGQDVLRITGATPWEKDTNDRILAYFPQNAPYFNRPYEQISEYIRSFHHHRAVTDTPSKAFEYWARTITGGPLAFSAIPKINLSIPCEQLTPHHLQQPLQNIATPLAKGPYPGFNLTIPTPPDILAQPHAIIIGVDCFNTPFVAFSVKHAKKTETEEETASLILFAYQTNQVMASTDYHQVAYAPWKQGQLRLSNIKDLNYLLALFKRQTPEDTDRFRLQDVHLNV